MDAAKHLSKVSSARVLEAARIACISVDWAGKRIHFDPNACQLLPFLNRASQASSSLELSEWFSHFNEEARSILECLIAHSADVSVPLEVVLPMRPESSTESWFKICLWPEQAAGRERKRFVGYLQDVTETAKLEQRVHLMEARWRMAMDITGLSLVDIGIDSPDFYCSSNLQVLIASSQSGLSAMDDWLNSIHPRDRQGFERSLNTVLNFRQKGLFYSEHRLRQNNGLYRWYRFEGQMIEMGSPPGHPRFLGVYVPQSEMISSETAPGRLLRSVDETVNLAQKFENMQRAEFRSLLHDHYAQQLSAAKLQLDVLHGRYPGNSEQEGLLAKALELISRLIRDMRSALDSLQPAVLENRTLVEALREEVESLEGVGNTHFRLEVTHWVEAPCSALVEENLFYILREALHNARRYAHARQVLLRAECNGRQLVASVIDDGLGIDLTKAETRTGHYGLAFLRKRADAIGADLTIRYTGSGTEVRVELVIKEDEA